MIRASWYSSSFGVLFIIILLLLAGCTEDPLPPIGGRTLALGESHTCAIGADRRVRCWGSNRDGQLGNGTFKDGYSPTIVTGIEGALAVSAGEEHTCALLEAGEILCWGHNRYGQLGAGIDDHGSNIPVAVTGLRSTVSIATGRFHTCAVTAEGLVYCWGRNAVGQLGDGTSNDHHSPAQSNVSGAIDVSAGQAHTCALLDDGTVSCWGWSTFGQLGIGVSAGPEECKRDFASAMPCGKVPRKVPVIDNAIGISLGGNHALALLADHTALCWGDCPSDKNTNTGHYDEIAPIPREISERGAISLLSAGWRHDCAILAGGRPICWGSNGFGALGTGNEESSWLPVAVSGLTHAVTITAGQDHTCARAANGKMFCWGNNDHGQLGLGTNVGPEHDCGLACATADACPEYNCSTTPRRVVGLP